eukprot:4846707-Prymnesium_polylepis.1
MSDRTRQTCRTYENVCFVSDRQIVYAFVQKRAALSCAQRVHMKGVSCCVCNPRPVLSTAVGSACLDI